MRPRVRDVLLMLALLVLPTQAASEARLWGLTIGIDRYHSQGGELADLRGAVNDARDIAAALRAAGAVEVIELLDDAAHRDAIFAAVARLAGLARPGDTIVLSYAGHGGQEPTDDLIAEPDGLSEVTLLGGFRTTAPHNYQRIFDHEWRRLMRGLAGLTVVLVFDSCHSGTANRAAAIDLPWSPVRFAQYGPITDDQIPPARTGDGGTDAILPHEVYLGGTRDDLMVPEIEVANQWRGALSLAFAEALRGRADADGDGVLTRGELADYIDANVRTLSAARQFPQMSYLAIGTRAGDGLPLFAPAWATTGPEAEMSACTAAALATVQEVMTLRIAPDAVGAAAELSALPQVRIADPTEAGTLTLAADPGGGGLWAFGPTGDRAAGYPARVLDPGQAAALAERWRHAAALDRLAGCAAPLTARLVGPGGEGALHRAGERLHLTVAAPGEPYLTMIVLNGTGAAQLAYPVGADAERIDPAQALSLAFDVRAPHGTDLLIVLASAEPQPSLHRSLRSLDPRHPASHPAILTEALARTLAAGRHRIAVLPVHTAPH